MPKTGLKVIVNALFGSVTVILQLLIVILFALVLFTLFAIQFYAGALRNKCLQDPPRVMTYFQRAMYLRNSGEPQQLTINELISIIVGIALANKQWLCLIQIIGIMMARHMRCVVTTVVPGEHDVMNK
jgi:uncharacterized protein YneF (UPF0154 family)